MEKTLALFAKWKIEQPEQRRALYVHSSHQHTAENIIYMICSWDYIYRPSDLKLEGLVSVFISDDAAGEINVSGSDRKKALNLLGNPKVKTSIEGTDKSIKLDMQKAGGTTIGGVANYNLMTKAIETTLPVCMSKVDWHSPPLSQVIKGGVGGKQPTNAAFKLVKVVSQYWGAAVVDLGLT